MDMPPWTFHPVDPRLFEHAVIRTLRLLKSICIPRGFSLLQVQLKIKNRLELEDK